MRNVDPTAGGLPPGRKSLRVGTMSLNRSALTVVGKTAGEIVDAAVIENADVIHSASAPAEAEGSLFILKGSLAPGGAVVKASGYVPE